MPSLMCRARRRAFDCRKGIRTRKPGAHTARGAAGSGWEPSKKADSATTGFVSRGRPLDILPVL